MTASRKLNIADVGTREPALLLVHGFGCTLDDWKAQIDALSGTFRCIALDLPGHGASAAAEAPTMAMLASAVNVAKDRSGARHVILVGHSLGAKVVREAYARSRANVAGMVLIEGRFNPGERDALLEAATRAIDSDGFGPWAQRHFAEMFVESSDPEQRARILERVRRLDPTFGRALYLEAVGWDPVRGKATLEDIAVPVLLLQSTYVNPESRRLPLRPGMTTPFIELVTGMVPQCDAKIVTGCGHFPMLEVPHVVNEELRAFATRLSE